MPRSGSGPLLVPLSTGRPISSQVSAPKRQPGIGQGDQRGTNKNPPDKR